MQVILADSDVALPRNFKDWVCASVVLLGEIINCQYYRVDSELVCYVDAEDERTRTRAACFRSGYTSRR